MESNLVLFKRLHESARIPSRAYASAGFDLFPVESGIVPPDGVGVIRLGFATEFSRELVAVIDDRYSTGCKEIQHLAGVIDSDFRGEWILRLKNLGSQPWDYSPRSAVAQALFLWLPPVKFVETSTLSSSDRGEKHGGSSDSSHENWEAAQ